MTNPVGTSKIAYLYEQLLEKETNGTINWNEFFLLHFNGSALRDVLYKIPPESLASKRILLSELTNQCVAVIASSRNIKFYNACSTLTTSLFAIANTMGMFDDFLATVFGDDFDVILRKLVSSLANVLKTEGSIHLKIITMDTVLCLLSICTDLTENCLAPYFFCDEFQKTFEVIFSDPELRITLGPDAIKILALLKTREHFTKDSTELKSVLEDNIAIMGFVHVFSTWLRVQSDRFLLSIGQFFRDEFEPLISFTRKAEHLSSVGIQNSFDESESTESTFMEEVEFLLAFFNVVVCSRKVTGSLLTVPPTESFDEDSTLATCQEHSVLCSLFSYSSFVFSDLKGGQSKRCAEMILRLLLRIADDGYMQNAFHDVALSTAVPLYIKPQLHRSGHLDHGNANQTVATSLLSLLAEFLRSHLTRTLLFDHYQIAIGIIHRIVVHEKKSRLRTGCWKQLFLALMSVLQFLGSNEQHLSSLGDVFRLASQVMVVVNLFITYGDVLLPDASSYDFLYYEIVRQHGVFTRLSQAACSHIQKCSLVDKGSDTSHSSLKNEWPAKLINQLMNALSIVNHITPKLTEISMKQGTLSEELVLKVVQESFDSLNLKLYDGLDVFEIVDPHNETGFLLEMSNSVIKDFWEHRVPIDNLIIYRQLRMVAENGVGSPKRFYAPSEDEPNAEKEVMLRIQDLYHIQFANYEEFYRWTCDNYAEFWEVVLNYCDVKMGSPYKQVIDKTKTIADIPAWFEGATLNYAENCLRKGGDSQTAIVVASNDGSLTSYDYRTLRNDVAFIASALRKFDVKVGDHVCGYLPNTYETTVAMLATASIGAVWSSASVDFGVVGVCDRFRQVVPKVLFTVDGVTYKGKKHCLKEKVNAIVRDLATIDHVVIIPFLSTSADLKGYEDNAKYVLWNEFKHCVSDKPLPLQFEQVPFAHPLFVLFSSGTTGTPKAMVHTVGGTLLKHVEEHVVQANINSNDVVLFYTTCGWMMWNWLMTILYTGASLVLYDESPLEPDPHVLIKICSSTKATVLGMGAKLYDEYAKRGEDFYSMYDLEHLRLVLSTGSPLKPISFDYINEHIKPGVVIGSISGGTDIVGCFMGCTLNLPVVRGECQHLYLGMDVHAYNPNGESVENVQGELVCVTPFPSMPSHFIGDSGGKRYKRAYFEKYPNIWAHGDFCLINSETKGVTMLGRSDTTLNRGGVRIGTAEIYSVVDTIEQIEDCIVAGQNIPEVDDEHIILFLKMKKDSVLDANIISTIKSRIRTHMSPRHVPNAFFAVPDIPYTNSGKKVELAVKQIINGETVEKASSLRNPEALDYFVAFQTMSDEYRSSISARPSYNRTITTSGSGSYGPVASGNRVVKIVTEMSSSSMSSGMSPFGQNAASTIRDSREREKKEMSDLNDRLASYIEKVRFLEAQNRKLSADLEMLRSRWGKDTSSIKSMYESELSQAKTLIGDTEKEKNNLHDQVKKMTEELAEYRRKFEEAEHGHDVDRAKIDELLVTLSNIEAEINLLRRRIELLEEEILRIKKENNRLVAELQRCRTELDQETLNRIDYQNQVQTLLEEIDFMRRVHDSEIRELQAQAARDTTNENREFFKNELASAIRDIRAEYDQLNASNRNDMESWYKLKVQEIQTQSARQNMEHGYQKEEVKRLRTQLTDLRGKLADLEGRNALLEKQIQELNYQLEDDQRSYEAALNDRDAQIRKMREECQVLMVELQMLLDTKQNLDAEIAIYRKMLEGEGEGPGLRQLVEQVVKTTGINEVADTETMRVVKGETSSRQSYSRSAKGNVSIQETSPEGKFIVLENTHRAKEEPLGEWKLKRKIDGKREIVYTLPRDYILRPGKSVKIWARNQGGFHNPPDQLVFDGEDTFGVGSNVHTILYNKEGEERATHIQRSSQTVN